MRRTVRLARLSGVLIALAATLVSGSTRQAAVADEGCSNQSLRGAYGFASDGQVILPDGTEADIAAEGRIVFDGDGAFTGKETESFNGAINPISIFGTDSVQSDCTGTATVNGGPQTTHLRFMLVEGGQELDDIDTDPGVIAAGQITKQQVADCTNASLKGVYAFASSGSFHAPTEVADAAAFGRIVFDGRGGDTEISQSTIFGADTQTGTYTVSPDCTGSAMSTHHPSNAVDTVDFVLVEGGSEAKFVVTNPGVVFVGTVDKQPMDAE